MTYEQYWYGDPALIRDYRKADRIRRDRKDAESWLNGLYFMQAINATVGNMFREKGADPTEYPDRPLSMITPEDLARREREERERARLSLVAQLEAVRLARKAQEQGGG